MRKKIEPIAKSISNKTPYFCVGCPKNLPSLMNHCFCRTSSDTFCLQNNDLLKRLKMLKLVPNNHKHLFTFVGRHRLYFISGSHKDDPNWLLRQLRRRIIKIKITIRTRDIAIFISFGGLVLHRTIPKYYAESEIISQIIRTIEHSPYAIRSVSGFYNTFELMSLHDIRFLIVPLLPKHLRKAALQAEYL